jgi:hypothetical protein
MATQEWIKELTRLVPQWRDQPVSVSQIKQAMQSAGVKNDMQFPEYREWQLNHPNVFVVNPAKVTTATLANLLSNPVRLKQTWALLNAAQQAEITKQLKAVESPQPVSPGTAAPATPAASVPVKVTAQTRPYRLKIDNTVKSYQLVNKVWHEVTIGTDQTLQVGAAVKPYMIATLNALKKKVDAQRAAGNLTDSRISVKSAILESMHALLRESR